MNNEQRNGLLYHAFVGCGVSIFREYFENNRKYIEGELFNSFMKGIKNTPSNFSMSDKELLAEMRHFIFFSVMSHSGATVINASTTSPEDIAHHVVEKYESLEH